MILFFILPSNSSVLYIPSTVYGNWNIKAFLTPTTSKCKNQAVYLLFWGGSWREKKKKTLKLCSYWWKWSSHAGKSCRDACNISSWRGEWGLCDTSGVEVATHALVLHAKWMPHIQQPDIGRLMRSVNPPLSPESFLHTTWAQRQSCLTPVSTSAPPPASRRACLNHWPLLMDIYANHRKRLALSAALGLFSDHVNPPVCSLQRIRTGGDRPRPERERLYSRLKNLLTKDGQNCRSLVKVIVSCRVS